MTKFNPVFAVAAGVAALVALFTLVPASQADTGWKVRGTPGKAVLAQFDVANQLVRFYVGGKEVAILNGSTIQTSHATGR